MSVDFKLETIIILSLRIIDKIKFICYEEIR